MKETQVDTVKRLLRERPNQGISAHELIYQHGITRTAAIIWRLRHELGWSIDTYEKPGKTARYVLRSENAAPVQLGMTL